MMNLNEYIDEDITSEKQFSAREFSSHEKKMIQKDELDNSLK